MKVNDVIFERIKRTEWQQDWEALYTPLEASLDNQPQNETYFSSFTKTFGRCFTRMLIIFKNEVAAGWLSVTEYEELGTYLAQKASDPAYLQSWIATFRERADEIMPLVQLSPEEFLNIFPEFRVKYPAFGPYVVATKMAFDFLPPNKQTVASKLEDARKYSEKFYFYSGTLLNQVVRLVASRTNYPEDLIRQLTTEELQIYIDSNKLPSKSELESRATIVAIYLQNGKRYLLSESQISSVQKYWRKDVRKDELHGITAYPGKVIGRVRIIHDYRNSFLRKGEILVTGMTDPNFLPIIQKASAVVADNGGMLSHAAIAAREMKKPCVVGTKFATQIFKDGDMVEVDAGKGVVRKI